MTQSEAVWTKCSACRKDINFGAKYYLCSVSTCNHTRLGVKFCSSECWDSHLGMARHREAWAEEAKAPTKEQYMSSVSESASGESISRSPVREPVRKIVEPRNTNSHSDPAVSSNSSSLRIPSNLETLVVVSKVKQLIKDQSDFNTSQCCIDALTEKVAEAALKGIQSATQAGRKTVMGRDIK